MQISTLLIMETMVECTGIFRFLNDGRQTLKIKIIENEKGEPNAKLPNVCQR